ncbi:MAG: L-lactate dehydrogenase [Anaerolineales bacterium]|nr:L-lactate dehydrogenase [Chloroflexota bacterium]MBL6980888.1 L-lactate dehydrogenase [Anaerolineales bacterium]
MKVGIIGTGAVGASAGFAMVMRGVAREIVMVDLDQKRAQAEADDILHAVPFAHPVRVSAGEYSDLDKCKIVIITAGVAQKPTETRLELLSRNTAIFNQIVPKVLEHAREAILLVATNPVDVMTHITADIADKFSIHRSRVIGSGTTLDTARFRALLGGHLGVDPPHVHGYVLGEHGDSEVFPWSLVTVGGVPLEEFCRQWDICTDDAVKADIEDRVRGAAYTIIEGKGNTSFGIGSALTRIVEVILRDQRALLTVCTPVKDVAGVKNVTLSLPHLVGGQGILDTILLPLSLNKEEEAALHNSAKVIREAYESVVG